MSISSIIVLVVGATAILNVVLGIKTADAQKTRMYLSQAIGLLLLTIAVVAWPLVESDIQSIVGEHTEGLYIAIMSIAFVSSVMSLMWLVTSMIDEKKQKKI